MTKHEMRVIPRSLVGLSVVTHSCLVLCRHWCFVIRHCGPVGLGWFLRFQYIRGEAAPHGIFCDNPRYDELTQIIRAAGFGTDAGQLEPAERLAGDQGAGDLAIDVQIADAEFALDSANVVGAARINPTG